MKAARPCGVCKGRFPKPCIICGHFRKKRKKQMTNEELVARDAIREHVLNLDGLSRASLKHGNCSTGDGQLNIQIEYHRSFTQHIWEEVNIEGKSLPRVAKDHDLTVNIVKQLLATALMQQNLKKINRKVEDLPRPTHPYKTMAEKEKEWEAVRAKRDAPKPPRRTTFSKMEDVDDEPQSDSDGNIAMAGTSH